MGRRRVIVRFGGQWEGLAYLGGSTVVVHMDDTNDDRDHLMNLIRDALCGRRDSEYVLSYLTVLRDGSRCRALLDSDTDLLRLLVQEKRSDPMVYVFERDSVFASEVDVEGSGRRDTFEDDDDRMPPETEVPPETEGAHISDDEEDERRKNIIESVTTEFLAWIRQPEQVNRIFGHQNFTSEHQTGRDDDELRSLGNWSIPLVECDSALPLGWVEQPGPFTSELVVGATFQSKYELKMVVGMYHLEHMLEYVIDRSARNRIVFLCKHGRNNCTFRLCAQGPKDEGDSIWYITKLTLDHSCHLNVIRTAERTVTAKVAAVYFARRLVCEGVYLKPREMMEEMRREFGVHMLYSLALETRNIAIEKTYGDFDKSYQMVPSYLHLLRQRNPGTEYNMQISSEGVFCHMFLALGQCIRAFERYLRPVIVLDGTHLKGRNKGVLFVAVSKDGNEQLFPIAIGIGPIENDNF